MKISLAEVEKIAELVRLKFLAEEKVILQQELIQIIDYVEQLNEIDTSTVTPTSSIHSHLNVFRADKVVPGLSPEAVLANAPVQQASYFSVPKVI